MSKPARIYTQDEVNAILSRAAEQRSPVEGLTHEELLDTARQAGIPRDAVEAAARDMLRERASTDEDRAVAEELEIQRRRAWRGLLAHFITYASVNALLLAINVLTSPFPWAIFPALGWGVGIALHVFAVVFPSPRRAQRVRERLRKREEKARERLERERRQAANPVGESAKELGHAIERGVATVFAAAARRIHEEVARAEDPPGTTDGAPVRVATSKRVADDAAPRADEEEEDDAPAKEHGRERR